jgi:hypothetical protein
MRISVTILGVCLALLLAGGSALGQAKSPKALGQQVFQALKAGNTDDYVSHLIPEASHEKAKQLVDQERLATYIVSSAYPKTYANFKAHTRLQFSEAAHIMKNWGSPQAARLRKVNFEKVEAAGHTYLKNFSLELYHRGQNYEIGLPSAVQMDGQWYLLGPPRVPRTTTRTKM